MKRLLLPAGLATLTLGVAACGGGGYSEFIAFCSQQHAAARRRNHHQRRSREWQPIVFTESSDSTNGTDRGVAQRRYDDAPRGAQRRQTGYRKPRTRRVQRADDARRANPLPLLDSSRHGRLACESVKVTLSEGTERDSMTWRCTPQRANPWPVSRARSCGAYVAVLTRSAEPACVRERCGALVAAGRVARRAICRELHSCLGV